LLVVSESNLVERMLSRGRPDDTIATIKTRLKVFRRQTEPLIGYYREKARFVEIDGLGDIQEVHLRMRAVMEFSI